MWILFVLLAIVALFILGSRNSDESGNQDVDDQSNTSSELKVFEKLIIKYKDSNGTVTQREIHTSAYDPDREHIRAKCMLRKQERTFRIDRITEAIDKDSGEIVTTRLRSFLRKRRIRT